MTTVDFGRGGPWRALWPRALNLMTHLERVTNNPPWTFGGGTVFMLRFDHRFSEDIDIFVPDPQYLGYVNPRLGGPAEDLTSEYEENIQCCGRSSIDPFAGTSLAHERALKILARTGVAE